nr:hypothetical protein [uncultured Albidiferax sp.]
MVTRAELRDEIGSDMKSGVILQRSLVKVSPELSNTRIDYCWGGVVAYGTPQDLLQKQEQPQAASCQRPNPAPHDLAPPLS